MSSFLSDLQSFLTLDKINIDNNIFKLHYKVTGIMLIVFSLLVTERQYIGDPIDCIVDMIPPEMMDTYCWIHSTYTIRNVSALVPHPGVAPNSFGEEHVYHKYYQWVTLVLFFQALMFYIPRYLWKSWEGKKIQSLLMQLNVPVFDDEVRESRRANLIDYYLKNLHEHNRYGGKFVLCEVLNFVNVIFQIFFTDAFLNNQFTGYGALVVEYSNTKYGTSINPMDKVFPKIAKCTFHRFGPSGTVERIDALCVLPVNVLNEKIYIVLWFWFIILAILSGLGLIYRMATFVPSFRAVLLRGRCRFSDAEKVNEVNSMCDFGDWFVMYQLCKNMDPLAFAEVMTDLYTHSRKEESEQQIYENAATLPIKNHLRHSTPN